MSSRLHGRGAGAGRAAAVDSTPLRARGGEWHRTHRLAGGVPHASLDPGAGWTRSGRHGWVYGWTLHPAVTAAAVWIPLAAGLTPANVADDVAAPALLPELPPDVRLLLADVASDDPAPRTGRRQAPRCDPRQCRAAGSASVDRVWTRPPTPARVGRGAGRS